MLDAFRAWRDLEADAGQALYIRTGGVSICPEPVDYVERVAASLALDRYPSPADDRTRSGTDARPSSG